MFQNIVGLFIGIFSLIPGRPGTGNRVGRSPISILHRALYSVKARASGIGSADRASPGVSASMHLRTRNQWSMADADEVFLIPLR